MKDISRFDTSHSYYMHVYFLAISMSCLELTEAEFIQIHLVTLMEMLLTSAFIATIINFPARKTLTFCSPRSRLALGPTQPSLQCILEAPFTDMQELGHAELMITHFNCLRRESTELYLHSPMSSWHRA
jgi:hypothetical protein